MFLFTFTDTETTMRIFEDGDTGYLAWVASHQHGFVVNTTRKRECVRG